MLARVSVLEQAPKWMQRLHAVFLFILLGSVALAAAQETPLPFAFPAGLLLLGATLVDIRFLFVVLLFTTAFSLNLEFPGGLTLDTPSEPLMIACTLLFVLFALLGNVPHDRAATLRHPLLILLYLCVAWSGLTMLWSLMPLVTFKYLLAKGWYYGAYVFFALLVIGKLDDLKRILWPLLLGYLLVTLVVTVRMAMVGFNVDLLFATMNPFFRNHVIYGCTVAMLVPVYWMASRWYTSGSWRRNLLLVGMGLMVLATFLSYTRASWISLPVAVVVLWVVHKRLLNLTLTLVLAGVGGLLVFLGMGNRYLDYAGNFQNAIYYAQDINQHLEATLNFEDLSGMERLYRWAAAKNMFLDRPVLGFGANTFNEAYRPYTITAFETLVSDNPERSTVHNNWLLVLTEQGLVGFALFTLLTIFTLYALEGMYHRTARLPQLRNVVVGVLLSYSVILFHMLLNDVTETDKIGTFFLLLMLLTARLDYWIDSATDKVSQDPV